MPHTPPYQPSTLSLHDALPIFPRVSTNARRDGAPTRCPSSRRTADAVHVENQHQGESEAARPGRLRVRCEPAADPDRSEEHTSELQSLRHLVCRLLLEKKKGDY